MIKLLSAFWDNSTLAKPQNNGNQKPTSKEDLEKRVDEGTQRAIKDYDKTFKILTEYDR